MMLKMGKINEEFAKLERPMGAGDVLTAVSNATDYSLTAPTLTHNLPSQRQGPQPRLPWGACAVTASPWSCTTRLARSQLLVWASRANRGIPSVA